MSANAKPVVAQAAVEKAMERTFSDDELAMAEANVARMVVSDVYVVEAPLPDHCFQLLFTQILSDFTDSLPSSPESRGTMEPADE